MSRGVNLASFHIEKGKYGGAMGHHIDRTEGMEHTYEDADPSRRHLNQELSKWKDLKMFEAVNEVIDNRPEVKRLEAEGKKPRAVRKDAVRYLDIHMGGSHEQMKKIEGEGRIDEWYKACFDFAKEEYGEDNIIRFALHMDETTPHIHCIAVPIAEDGCLSAKKVMGSKFDLIAMQDKYAKVVEPFGLVRGQRNSLSVHDGKQEYERRLRKAELKVEDMEQKGLFGGVDKGKTIKELKKALTSSIAEAEKLQNALDQSSIKLEQKEKELQNNLQHSIFNFQQRMKEMEMNHQREVKNIKEDLKLKNSRINKLIRLGIDNNMSISKEDMTSFMKEIIEEQSQKTTQAKSNRLDQKDDHNRGPKQSF